MRFISLLCGLPLATSGAQASTPDDLRTLLFAGKFDADGRHVQLSAWLQASEAWKGLRPGPRAHYIEFKRRLTGSNNGEIFLSHRGAAKAQNVNKNTATGFLADLIGRGFIHLTQGPHPGHIGIGVASKWDLDEERAKDGKAPAKAFMAWRANQNPSPKNGTPRPNKRDTLPPNPANHTVPNFGTQSAIC